MATRALPPGAIRRRAMFGLLDADGWTWALLKALFWFVVIIALLGYIPDRAYYFTVSPTIDVGFNVISPVNFCPAENEDLPCPAPQGAVIPWQTSPRELALPEPRAGLGTAQSGTSLYAVGGATPAGATASVLTTQVLAETGNFGPWSEGPALPAPRTEAAVVSFSGIPYVIGGLDERGRATDTVFMGAVQNGQLTGWEENPDLRLPQPLAGAAVVSGSGGIYVMGGTDGQKPSNAVYRSALNETTEPPALGPWEEFGHLPLPEARVNAVGVSIGNFIYVIGGEGPNGVASSIMRLELDNKGGPRTDAETNQPLGWATSPPGQSLPAGRTQAIGFQANNALYVLGGRDPGGSVATTSYWTVPDATSGNISEWRQLGQTDLPEPHANGATAVIGSFAFLVGGETDAGPTTGSMRTDLAPRPPFFRLGLFGMTVPALSIQGEVGQQLGYLNAAGVGTVNFVLLVLIGIAFSHRTATRRVLERVTRGRIRAPRDDPYFSR